MPTSTERLIDSIESSMFLLVAPGIFDEVDIPGLKGRQSAVSHPLANLVGAAELTSHTADETISLVIDRFQARAQSFGWLVGPSSTPSDLAQRLVARGLTVGEEMAGMAVTDLGAPLAANDEVAVREASPAEVRASVGMIARGYGLPADVAAAVTEASLALAGPLRLRAYLAHLPGVDGPVAFGNSLHVPGTSTVLLGGAATLPEYRGRGVYTSLVARRIADARQDGADSAVIQAVRSTSAPICRSLGFVELSALDLYVGA